MGDSTTVCAGSRLLSLAVATFIYLPLGLEREGQARPLLSRLFLSLTYLSQSLLFSTLCG